MLQEKKKKTLLKILYLLVRSAVVIVIIEQFRLQNYSSALLAAFTFLVFIIPSFIERRMHVRIPDYIESMLLISIFASVILGEIGSFYILFPHWDNILHVLNGFMAGAIGYSLIDIANRKKGITEVISPAFTMLFIICFAIALGDLWEFCEFMGDSFFGKDMQKDVYIDQINSILLNPENVNVPVRISIDSVVVNGEKWPGYVDIGLIDTMKDMLLNISGAVVFAVYFIIRIKKKGKNEQQKYLLHKDEKMKKS